MKQNHQIEFKKNLELYIYIEKMILTIFNIKFGIQFGEYIKVFLQKTLLNKKLLIYIIFLKTYLFHFLKILDGFINHQIHGTIADIVWIR